MVAVVADSLKALDCKRSRKQVQDAIRHENSTSTFHNPHNDTDEKKNLSLLIANTEDKTKNEIFLFTEGHDYGRPNTNWTIPTIPTLHIPNSPTETLFQRNKNFHSDSSSNSTINAPTDEESSCDESTVDILAVDLG